MKKSLIMISLALLALSGCTAGGQKEAQQPNVPQNQQQTQQPDTNQDQSQTKNPNEGQDQGQAKQPEQKEVSEIKEKLQIGQSQEEVKALLGEGFIELTSAEEHKPLWRYDIGAQAGYKPDEAEDFVDIDGLKEGKLEIQVFVTWSEENKAESITVYYLNPDENKVYEYRVFPDGTVRETAIA